MTDAVQNQNQISGARQWLDQKGLNLPIWLTEFGVIWGYDRYPIDGSAVFAHGIDFHARGGIRHDDRAGLAEATARCRERLPEISRRGGDDVLLRNRCCHIVSGAKFETARMLKCLADNGHFFLVRVVVV